MQVCHLFVSLKLSRN